jgi:hypothetical protein
MGDLDFLAVENGSARKSDYARTALGRYPDPANLLPISADARSFVHFFVDSALTWC